MARRGGTHRGVEEKRRSLPIYQHYTLSPGKTKSHHPEAKCNHCHKEFVCGSKQRLIKHLRKCSCIQNPEQIIAETLNSLAQSSPSGINQSILEASNATPATIASITGNNSLNIGMQNNNNSSMDPTGQNQISTRKGARRGRKSGQHNASSNSLNINQAIPFPQFTAASLTGANAGVSGITPSGIIKLNHEPVDKAYLKLVITRNLPLSLSDTKEFQAWVKTFATDYKPPTSINLITQNLKMEATLVKQRIANILVKASKKTVNLELHNWSDSLRGRLMYAIIANLEHKRFLISLHDIIDVPDEAQWAQKITDFIDDCVKRIGSDRINSLIFTDPETDAFAIAARQSTYELYPSIVTYYCWVHFTNLLCSDIVDYNQQFRDVMRNSNRLINFINQRPRLSLSLEKFNPTICGSICKTRRWYSYLVIYMLEYIKNNSEGILRTVEQFTPNTTQQTIDDAQFYEVKQIVESAEFWNNLNLALAYLKPIQDLVALTTTIHISTVQTGPSEATGIITTTTTTNASATTSLTLSDFMNWLLLYGKTLFENWKQGADSYKQHLIECYLKRFCASELKLLFAAYLLNPKHRCAYMTKTAKDAAIEEILTIASEFMSEESDGHTIFEQWKLFLRREEPYDILYDETKSAIDWWLSLPCAESIRRVALRILRLKAMSSAKSESLFSLIHYYEDDNSTRFDTSTFEDFAILRYFYDYEDKIGYASGSGANQMDRSLIGQLHNQHQHQSIALSSSTKLLPGGDNQQNSVTTDGEMLMNSYVEVVVDEYENHIERPSNVGIGNLPTAMIEDSPEYHIFKSYVDYDDAGVTIVEEPLEKKRKKWTAQEILSKFQTNSHPQDTQQGQEVQE